MSMRRTLLANVWLQLLLVGVVVVLANTWAARTFTASTSPPTGSTRST